MGFFSKIFKKEQKIHLENCYLEENIESKKFIIAKDENLYSGVEFFHELIKDNLNNIVIICVGTDKWIFDSLAPFVGSILKSRGFNFPIYGTIEHPIHALNLEASLIEIKKNHPNGFFIAIDACYCDEDSLFSIHLRNSPLHPGTGVNKDLPVVGNVSIVGTIAVSDDDAKLHEIRLKDVISMANKIANIIIGAVEGCLPDSFYKNNFSVAFF